MRPLPGAQMRFSGSVPVPQPDPMLLHEGGGEADTVGQGSNLCGLRFLGYDPTYSLKHSLSV